jgi:hypothetical protein
MNIVNRYARRESGIENRESAKQVLSLFRFPIPHSRFPAPQGANA